MNTRMIEVALGLVLVFAMTSLLLTAVRELWASAWGSRGKILVEALTSFVGDDRDFALKLMQHPLLVSLSKDPASKGSSPSYMGADIVISSLVASLVERIPGGVRPSRPADFVKALQQLGGSAAGAVVKDSADPNAAFVRGMTSLIHGVEDDWAAYQARLCAWYDSVTERSTGWFKRKNQVSLLILGFMVAAIANINPILIATRLWEDAPLREAIAAAAQNAADSSTVAPTMTTEGAPNCEGIKDPQVQAFCVRLKEINDLKNTGLPMGWNPLVIPNVFGAERSSNYDVRAWGNLALLIVGWLVTAVAVSLGAPFWFDALGKVASLRSAGPRPSAADRSGIAATPPGGTTMSQPVSSSVAPAPSAQP